MLSVVFCRYAECRGATNQTQLGKKRKHCNQFTFGIEKPVVEKPGIENEFNFQLILDLIAKALEYCKTSKKNCRRNLSLLCFFNDSRFSGQMILPTNAN